MRADLKSINVKNFLSCCLGSTAHLVALQKLVQALTGLVTALLVTQYLTPNEQGYFYTIGSLLSSYILLDFGLSNLIVQVSARYFSDLSWNKGFIFSPEEKAKSSFFALAEWVGRWYFKLGVLTLILIPLGFLYFSFAKTSDGVQWQLPWVAVVCFLALSMPATGFLALLEGAGKINEVYVIRMLHYLFGALLAWTLLALGYGLFAQSMAPLAISVIVYYWVWIKFQPFLKDTLFNKTEFPWKTELWPQQKKVGLSWTSNYLFLHVPVPIVFYFSGSVEAGKMGLSMVIANVSCAIALSWITAVTPRVSSLVAGGDVLEAKNIFIKAFAVSSVLLVLGIMTFFLIQSNFQENSMAQRILSPIQTLLIFVTFAAFHSINGLIVYFRAFKKELLALPNLIATLMIMIGGCLIVPQNGAGQLIVLMAATYVMLMIYALFNFWRFDDKEVSHA